MNSRNKIHIDDNEKLVGKLIQHQKINSLDQNTNIVGGEAASKLMIDSCVAEELQHQNQPNLAEKRGAMFDESNIKCSIEIKNGMTSKKTNVKQTNELILHSYSVSTVQ